MTAVERLRDNEVWEGVRKRLIAAGWRRERVARLELDIASLPDQHMHRHAEDTAPERARRLKALARRFRGLATACINDQDARRLTLLSVEDWGTDSDFVLLADNEKTATGEGRRSPRMEHTERLHRLTGLPRGALELARWADVTLEGKSPTWRIPAEHSKTGAPHTVPLSPSAVAELRKLRANANGVRLLRGGATNRPALPLLLKLIADELDEQSRRGPVGFKARRMTLDAFVVRGVAKRLAETGLFKHLKRRPIAEIAACASAVLDKTLPPETVRKLLDRSR